MNDPAELLLRDVLAEEAESAPPAAADLARAAQRELDGRRLRRRRVVAAGLAAAASVAVVGGTAGTVLRVRDRARLAPADAAALFETEWQLVEYVRGGRKVEMGVTDAWVSLSRDRTYAGVVCNHISGAAYVDGDQIAFQPGSTTLMACRPPASDAQDDFTAFAEEGARWRVTDGRLRLEGQNGDYFLFRVRESIFPDPAAATLVAGTHAGTQYRLAYADGDTLVFDARHGPGEEWYGEKAAEDRAHPLSWALRVPLGGGTQFVAGWATRDTASVSHQARGGARTRLTIYHVARGKVFGGLVPANPKGSVIRLHRKDGSVVATFTENRPD
ncbi:MAG TPA: META domain-containing protein [Frankiaceae bacterium]|nr:META domain-containing protein [Frankiaceae bacterium]